MGYADNLISILKPMCLYNLTDGDGYAELRAIGKALDSAKAYIYSAERECFVTTAENAGLARFESLFPMASLYESIEDRRNALCTALSADDGSNTVQALENIFDALGVPCEISEKNRLFASDIVFTGHRGEATNAELAAVKLVMPAHIECECSGVCVTWNRLEELYDTWDDMDDTEYTISELMCLE